MTIPLACTDQIRLYALGNLQFITLVLKTSVLGIEAIFGNSSFNSSRLEDQSTTVYLHLNNTSSSSTHGF